MKIVVLEDYALTPGDLDWSPLYELGAQVERYPRTTQEQALERIGDAEYVIVNKVWIAAELLEQCPNLKWVGLTATGIDSLDPAACARHGVAVANVPGYSTQSVAQMTWALLLELCQCAGRYDTAVRKGYWKDQPAEQHGIFPQRELYGKTLGIVGYGAIGRQVAAIAAAFGMKVLCCTRTPRDGEQAVEFVSMQELFRRSDAISLHCPATETTKGFVNQSLLSQCKPGALLVNTARGSLVDEQAVCDALNSGILGGFAADVLCVEPADITRPIFRAPNTIFTPHAAWATKESLERLSAEVCSNLKAFLQGETRNIVNQREKYL